MYMRMLVLLDGSELAETVFKYARELSQRLHVNLDLLHVCNPQNAGLLPMCKAYIEQKAALLQAEIDQANSKYGESAMGEAIRTRGTVVVGYHAEEILKYIEENDIDLVLLSTHGSSGIKAWDLGSVADKIVHASKVPVWLVPSELSEEVIVDKLPTRSLLLPLSGSKVSEAVIPYALSIVQRRGPGPELVILLHVINPKGPDGEPLAEDEMEKRRQHMREYLEGVAARVRESGFSTRIEILEGEPASSIIKFTEEYPPQLLALTVRGHTEMSGMIFGSVAESIIRLVKKTPMLLVRAES
ncbi:MAG: universal stress protein [Thermoleophilia bacterium]|nr:universal stress protein [Thermoleophilia bacterium]